MKCRRLQAGAFAAKQDDGGSEGEDVKEALPPFVAALQEVATQVARAQQAAAVAEPQRAAKRRRLAQGEDEDGARFLRGVGQGGNEPVELVRRLPQLGRGAFTQSSAAAASRPQRNTHASQRRRRDGGGCVAANSS
jgi:hypothetical protein